MYFIFLYPTVSLFFLDPSNLLTISIIILPFGMTEWFHSQSQHFDTTG